MRIIKPGIPQKKTEVNVKCPLCKCEFAFTQDDTEPLTDPTMGRGFEIKCPTEHCNWSSWVPDHVF